MFEQPGNKLRPSGVKVAVPGDAPAGVKPQTVEIIFPLQFYAVQLVDGYGQRKKVTYAEMNGEFYAAPNSEEWTSKLNIAPKWVNDLLKQRIAAQVPFEVPGEDNVDVMSGADFGDKVDVVGSSEGEAAEE